MSQKIKHKSETFKCEKCTAGHVFTNSARKKKKRNKQHIKTKSYVNKVKEQHEISVGSYLRGCDICNDMNEADSQKSGLELRIPESLCVVILKDDVGFCFTYLIDINK